MTARDLARTPARLARFVDERLRPAVIVRTAPVTIEHWVVPGEPVPFAHAVRQVFTPFAVGRSWGRPWGTVWLRVRGTVPEEWVRDARHGVELVADLGFDRLSPGFQAEGLAFRPDGSIVKAISPRNAHVPVEGDDLDLYVELAANPGIHPESHWVPTRLGDPATAGDDELYRLDRLEIALVDREAWALVQDIEVLRGLAGELPADRPRRSQLWHALDRMLDAVDPDDLAGSIPSARAALAPALAAPAAASAHTIIATGHAHIDSAWLWPVRETVRKCARTFSNVLALLDEHPQLRFACSSAQQLAWMKEHYPALFERIRAQVAAGRFVPVGGQWVEPDTNMPSGESTVRQFLLGKRFFLEEFGVDTTEVWLPDTFGYSAALPQLIRLAGADWFMTQKISWNETNRMPHHTFWWEGIDGTRVFTHFPPIETYNAELSPRELAHAERTFRDHATASVSLAPFGWGDGGGGPTREMVAAGRRQADLDGSPRVEFGSPRDFYERAAAESGELPVWSGEMYLELHRGTLTSQLRTKQGNRRSEEALRHAELWATTAAIRTGAPYPYDELTRCWERVLLLQFHDILPGSSIAWVHREAEEDHARIIRELDELTAAALGMLAGEGDRELVANAAPIAVEHAPPLAVSAAPAAAAPATLQASERGWVLATDHVRAEVDRDGHLISLRDPSGREALAPGASAMLSLHRDRPGQWDAWDVDRSDHAHGVDLRDADEVVADVVDGVAAVHATRSVGASRIRQTISLAPGAHAVDIALDIDWRERHRLLRFVVPVDVLADRSTSEIQFGHLHRPTHANTSWDAARFEFVAHRWIHVGEAGYGVAVANDSTYGHSVERTTRPDGGTTTSIGLSVLRSPGFPDPGADRGRHRMRFAIRPGATLEDAAHEGFRLGGALRTIRGGRNVPPIVTSTDPAVRVEAVKLAEDRSGDLIVRVVESLGGRATTTVAVDAPVAHAEVVDLIERRIEGGVEMQGDPASLTLELRPFQVVTLRYRMRGGA